MNGNVPEVSSLIPTTTTFSFIITSFFTITSMSKNQRKCLDIIVPSPDHLLYTHPNPSFDHSPRQPVLRVVRLVWLGLQSGENPFRERDFFGEGGEGQRVESWTEEVVGT
ncbi:hypothetical protein D9758_015165 [Tetrapyrgos nigripes]|uniref:Uncharacterized protein n=1 Tax=Tetrapyrgos nigripes TaxID=182062 RepID=A0A8H5FQ93_9AGAR|nr:hypothetical protein D9758_015165 [Tetrapyrgos nigripes]